MEWTEFEQRFCWFIEKKEREKTIQALQVFAKKAPDEVFKDLEVWIIGPSHLSGCAWKSPSHQWYIYLDPSLETDTLEQVTFTVAHEFAHVFLKHIGHPAVSNEMPYDERFQEWEANELAKSWGFYNPDEKQGYLYRFWTREGNLWD